MIDIDIITAQGLIERVYESAKRSYAIADVMQDLIDARIYRNHVNMGFDQFFTSMDHGHQCMDAMNALQHAIYNY